MLLLTMGWVALTLTNRGLGKFVVKSIWLLIVLSVLQVVVMVMVACCRELAVKVPLNYGLLLFYTCCQAYVVGYFCCMYGYNWDFTPSEQGRKLVLTAFGTTVGLTAALAFIGTQRLFSLQTWMFVVMGLLVASLMAPFMIFFSPLRGFFVWVMIVAVSAYLIFDVQMIEEGVYGVDGYIIAAIAVYTDIVQLFLYILQAAGD